MSSSCHCGTLRLAARKLSAAYDEALAPLGITIAQLSLLRTIERGQPVSMTALGRLQELDRSTVGRNVRVLERMGLVEAGRSEDDQRETVVHLRESGRALLARAAPAWEDCQRDLEARLGAERLAALRDILQAI